MPKTKTKMDDATGCMCCCGPKHGFVRSLLALLVPFLLLWSLNTLFMTNLAMTPYTWFAAFVLVFVFGRRSAWRMHFFGSCHCGGECGCDTGRC